MRTTCKTCGKQWGGLQPEHCVACHETFSGTTSGDKHRRGEYPERYCTTEGLVFNEKRQLWQLPGTWRPGVGDDEEAPNGAA